MTQDTFRAPVVRQTNDVAYSRTVETRHTDELPANDLLVRVHYSLLNYKNALSASSNRGATRNYPHNRYYLAGWTDGACSSRA